MDTTSFSRSISAQSLENWIDKKEISKARTPREFIYWFDKKLDAIERLSPDLRRQILLREGIAKVFYEELFPLYRLSEHKIEEWIDVEFVPTLGYKNFDVSIKSGRNNFLKYIEITQAGMNESEYLRRLYLSRHSCTNMIGEVLKEGTKKTGLKISIRHELMRQDELNSQMVNCIKDAIERKHKVQKRPDKTALLVYFDDYRTFSREEDRKLMSKFLDSVCNLWRMDYASLFVVGTSGEGFWEKV